MLVAERCQRAAREGAGRTCVSAMDDGWSDSRPWSGEQLTMSTASKHGGLSTARTAYRVEVERQKPTSSAELISSTRTRDQIGWERRQERSGDAALDGKGESTARRRGRSAWSCTGIGASGRGIEGN